MWCNPNGISLLCFKYNLYFTDWDKRRFTPYVAENFTENWLLTKSNGKNELKHHRIHRDITDECASEWTDKNKITEFLRIFS